MTVDPFSHSLGLKESARRGSGESVGEFKALLEDKKWVKGIPRSQRYVDRQSLGKISS